LPRGYGAGVSRLERISAIAAAVLCIGSPASAGQPPSPRFRDDAAEVSAAARLLSAYGIVTSTFRTVAHNKAVGGVPNSYHLVARAIDIVRRPGITHSQIEGALKRGGYRLIESLDEHDHSHFAFATLPGSTTIAPASGSSPPPAPPLKPLPRVAADEHGTLSLDLEAPPRPSALGPAKPRPPGDR
jgi:zinc D-Ala-D-Ala carboxypeptidase